MRLKVLHGYFIFEETKVGQISDFMSYSGFPLVFRDTYYTFDFIKDAPDYSLPGLAMLGIPAVKTFEGTPWAVFEANGFVYDFQKNLVVPITSITQVVKIEQAGELLVAPGLILPGSLTTKGKRVTGYDAWFSRDRLSWLYSAVDYV